MWRLHEKDKRKYDLARRYGLTQRLLEVGWAGNKLDEAMRSADFFARQLTEMIEGR